MILSVIVICLVASVLNSRANSDSAPMSGCVYEAKDSNPTVYWINLERSSERKERMNATLGKVKLKGVRIKALEPSQIYIPPDIEKTWPGAWCILDLPNIEKPTPKVDPASNSSSAPHRAVMTGMCGRGRKNNRGNTIKELGCTTSHMLAMREAIDSREDPHKYAIIAEDDIIFPFDIDYKALIESAPKDFGILQLFNSNPASMKATWQRYVKDTSNIWVERHPIKFMDFWSTCAYLINKEVMREVIDGVAVYKDDWLQLKVIAGITSPCVPKGCCEGNKFLFKPPCVYAPRGYQADSLIYAMTKTYVLSMPLITAGSAGNTSTFHQDHVGIFHRTAFQQQREYMAQMISGHVKPPDFAKPACSEDFAF